MKWIIALACVGVIAGCNSKDAENLGQDAKTLAQDAGKAVSGLSLKGKIKTLLAWRKDVDSKDIDIETKEGLVTVTGHVKSSEEKGRVYDLINNTVGVDKVDATALKVVP